MPEKKSFWATLPGILTGIAAIVTATTGLYLAFVGPRPEPIPQAPEAGQDSPVSECDERVNKAWEIIRAHRGNLTDAIDDTLAFQELVLDIGCLEHSYTLDLGGKQNIGRFTITVLKEWPFSPSPGRTYHYKEFVTTIEVQGQTKNATGTARRIQGSSDPWEELD